jgi:hypothetical protein
MAKKDETTSSKPIDVQTPQYKDINFVGAHERLIPKLCTGVFFQVAGEKLILTLGYHEGKEPKQITVIERAAIDIELTKTMLESLQKVIEDFEKGKQKKEENSELAK